MALGGSGPHDILLGSIFCCRCLFAVLMLGKPWESWAKIGISRFFVCIFLWAVLIVMSIHE